MAVEPPLGFMTLVVVDVCRSFKRRQLVCWLQPNSYERRLKMGYSENRNMDLFDHFEGSNFMQSKAVNGSDVFKCNNVKVDNL